MAIRFDASGDSLSRARLAGAKTVMAWIYISTDRNDYTAFFGCGNNEIVATTITGTTLLHYDGTTETTGTNLTAATWYHLAYVSQGDDINDDWAVYLNGVLDMSAAQRNNASTGTTMYLGNDTFSEWLNGRIAHVKIWNTNLTQAEIQQEMYTIRPQRFANLWCWMPMIETGASRDNEWSGSGNTFTENGTLTDETGPPVSWGVAPWVVPFVATGGGGTTYNQSAAGSLTPAGALSRSARKALAGTLAPAGALVRRTAKVFAGALAPVGALAKQTGKNLAGTVSLSGALAAIRTSLVAVGGSIAPTGSLTRQTMKSVVGSIVPSGALVRRVGKVLAGTLTPAGALATQLIGGVIEQAVGGTLALAGTLSRSTSKTLAGVLTPTGTVAKLTSKLLAGVLGLAGLLSRAVSGPSAFKADCAIATTSPYTVALATVAPYTVTLATVAPGAVAMETNT